MLYPAKEHVRQTGEKLVGLLPDVDRAKTQIVLLAGEVTPFRNDTDRELSFRQESNFYYLTGCNVPGSYLLAIYQVGTSFEKSPLVKLFIPKAELADIMWSIPPPSLDEASASHDVTNVYNVSTLVDQLTEALTAFPDAILHTFPTNSAVLPNFPAACASQILQAGRTLVDAHLLPAVHLARLIKDDFEIDLIRKANQISSRAHETVMRVLGKAVKGSITSPGPNANRPLLPGEWLIEQEAEAEAIFVASCRREGSIHQAYLPIVAGAQRASTLHYCCNDREFAWGPVKPTDHKNHDHFPQTGDKEFVPQVLLIDAGCEWSCYASDITRTMPVGNGGKFSPEARDIYNLVLDMQKAAMEITKPGVHWDTVHYTCHKVLVQGFQRLGIFKTPDSPSSGSWNSEESILASGDSAAFFPHGLGHSLGMDVHDVPSASKPTVNPTISETEKVGNPSYYTYLRLRLPLQKGMVVTIEPGCYFSPHLLAAIRDSKHINHDVLKRYESVGGVRIEDVVLITEDGFENLTTVRSETEWIEGVCAGDL
ncbi:Creatinase/aminopeptidase [Cylindrobasidium torrendii FP15055 ss-10]|uniref:Creatinase/aminopeptidase n=1 Tax=Cylindrobasidium torrendii FP15055 ss-10 TaxID=1314674 RepID=A0A0D7BDS9_9AGAR|nr:Creatinase/aminopeptidase [Cylindrobasidium torrendii FP15055 ss-10]